MQTVKSMAAHIGVYVRAMGKWLLVAAIIGTLGGAVGALFHMGVEYATQAHELAGATLWALPLGGVLIAWMYRTTRTEGEDTNAVIDAVHQGRSIPILLIPVIFLGTLITHLCGGSAGREGAALQIGGDLGEHIGKMLRLDDKDTRLATLCGMSALFSVLFGTPLTATIFALEVISVGVLYYAGFIPCLTSALTAYAIACWMGIAPLRFTVAAPALCVSGVLRVAVLALLCALVSIFFCETMHRTDHLAQEKVKNPYLRAALGGAVIIALTYAVGCGDYNGAGMDIIKLALDGQAKPSAFFWKTVFTAVTLGCGFCGGEVVPTFFVGAAFGCAAGPLLGIEAPFAAALGLVAVFCGAVNCPITSIILSVELFGAEGLLYFALACAVSYVLSGYRGIYRSQTILYSKLRAEFINVRTK